MADWAVTGIGVGVAVLVALLVYVVLRTKILGALEREILESPSEAHDDPTRNRPIKGDPQITNTQAEVFDHLLAIVPELGLRVFQNPTGADMARLAGATAELAGATHELSEGG